MVGGTSRDLPSLRDRLHLRTPFGRGKRFLNTGGVVNRVVGGWQTVSIIRCTTGTPVVLSGVGDPTGIFAGIDQGERPLWQSFEQTTATKTVTLPPGESAVKFAPAEFAQLTVQHPRLWWPNGYGKRELYRLRLAFSSTIGPSDTRELNFGIRKITYELSLYDSTGHLRRVEISPTTARARNEQIV
jgi:hypothetical protein